MASKPRHDTPDPRPDGRVEPLALSARDAATAIGIGERLLWTLTADRKNPIPHARIGRRVVYPVRELRTWLASRIEVRR